MLKNNAVGRVSSLLAFPASRGPRCSVRVFISEEMAGDKRCFWPRGLKKVPDAFVGHLRKLMDYALKLVRFRPL